MNTIITAHYSQKGHPDYREDTWSSKRIISSEEELFKAMKDWNNCSARTFNNYPLGGLFSTDKISFTSHECMTMNGKEYFTKPEDCQPPQYFQSACKRFDEWYNFLVNRLPKLEKARKERLIEESERMQLEALKEKYA